MSKNYRNGYSKKTVKTQLGEVAIAIPRDRNGQYEPQIIGKYSRNTDGMEEKILSLYAAGLSIPGAFILMITMSKYIRKDVLYVLYIHDNRNFSNCSI